MNYAWRKFLLNTREDPSSLVSVLARRVLSHRRPQFAQFIGRYGARPKFLVIGVQKGGTTSLYSYLAAHPQINGSVVKEVHYFDFHYACGETWYRAHFAPQSWLLSRGLVTGEASPEYIFSPFAPGRVASFDPDMKLVVMLRNPVERAYSQYQMSIRRERETLPFTEALVQETARLDKEYQKMGIEEAFAYGSSHRHQSYQLKGHYAEQLENWFKFFSPEQILVLESEAFFRDPATVYAQTIRFLGLPEYQLKNYRNVNNWGYSNLEPEIRAQLETYFAPHNARLTELLGRTFWEPSTPATAHSMAGIGA